MIISGFTAVGIIFPDEAQKEDALIHGGVCSKVHYRRRTTVTADDGGRCIARHRFRVQRLCCLIRFDQSVTGGKKNVRTRADEARGACVSVHKRCGRSKTLSIDKYLIPTTLTLARRAGG